MSSSRKCTGRLFQRRDPAAAKLLSSKCVVRPWNSTRSVGGRTESTSWTFWSQVYVVSQVRRCLAGQRRVNETWRYTWTWFDDIRQWTMLKDYVGEVKTTISSYSSYQPVKSPIQASPKGSPARKRVTWLKLQKAKKNFNLTDTSLQN